MVDLQHRRNRPRTIAAMWAFHGLGLPFTSRAGVSDSLTDQSHDNEGQPMQYIEIERKFRINDPDTLRSRLRELGASLEGEMRQVDTYYNAPHRDFLDAEIVSEWLRVRDEGGCSSLNLKRWLPLGSAESTHCDEFETPVADGEAVRRLLRALDFPELVTVDKVRQQWIAGPIVIAIDTVTRLGSFVEFEYHGDADYVETANTELDRFIACLGVDLGERDWRGYPYHLLERQS
jgi:adenylate cyclase class 2